MNPATCPALAAEGFRLRPMQLADAEAWYAYLELPQVVEHTSWNLRSVDELRPMLHWYTSDEPGSAIRFAIEETASGALAGTIGFHTISLANRTAELAYDLDPAYWGRGLATAACEAVTEWGFADQRWVRIQATVLQTNGRSLRVLERCGFAHEGLLRRYRMVRGVPGDFHLYARLSPGA